MKLFPALFAVTLSYTSAIATPSTPTYGSSFLPVDVVFDEAVRKALRNTNVEQRVVDEVLQTAGNENHVTLTLIGYKGGNPHQQINQDRAFIVNPFLQDYHLSGVFDGHGRLGEVVAEFAVTETPKRLAEKLLKISNNNDDDDDDDAAIVQALQETFVEIDRDIPTKGVGGCTASVVLRMGSKIYVANAGDSRSLVALHSPSPSDTNRKSELIYVSREDKPHLEDERARIESMGGTVWIPPNVEQESSRVMYVNPETGYQTGLAMSRSIGDWDMVGAIAEPLVEVIDLSKLSLDEEQCDDGDDASADKVCSSKRKSLFVISATDGMMDYISPEQLAESFARAFFDDTPHHPFNMAEDMIHQAAAGWDREMRGEYRDDIAVAASALSSVESTSSPPAQ